MTTLATMKRWLRLSNFQLAGQKTEAILITSRKKIEYITLKIDGYNITNLSASAYIFSCYD